MTLDSEGQAGWRRLYLGVALTTLATLVLELALTRIFSAVFYYHFAFLAISIALFGLGAGGISSYVVAPWRGRFFSKLGCLAALNGLAVLAALLRLVSITERPGNWTLATVYVASALPFFFSGITVSLAIAETVRRVDRVYFCDLLGAAGGCLLLIPLLNIFGCPNTLLIAAALFAACSAIWFSLGRNFRGALLGAVLSLLLVGTAAWNTGGFLDVRFAKGTKLGEEVFVKWNSMSRIAVKPTTWGGFLIVIDADASTAVFPWDLDNLSPPDRKHLLTAGPALPYLVRPGAKTLVIGSGGLDVGRALASGSRDVTAVEINPLIANTIMRDRFAGQSHRLYFRPDVRLFVEDGRSFVRRTREKYQVLQATLVDTWASTAAGAFALSESTLYTAEAFQDYLKCLTEDGIIAFTRWGFDPPRESLRLVSLAMDALRRLGQSEPWRHVVAGRENPQHAAIWGSLDTILISRNPFRPADLERARAALREARLEPLYLPGDLPANPFGELLLSRDPSQYQRQYRYDIAPVTDNRPFFFYTVQPRDVLEFLRNPMKDAADYKINRAVPLLFLVVGLSAAATAFVLGLPPLLLGSRLPRRKGVRRFLLYFAAIGVGYILIQIALIQKFVLFLGHPTYALTVVIFAMLVSSGLGSYFSRRAAVGTDHRLRRVLCGIALLVCLLAVAVPPLTGAGVGWPLGVRCAVTVLLIAGPGFLMGMPFPSGLVRLKAQHEPALRWAWALNAAASVLGSVLAVLVALYVGLRETLLLGGVLYLSAAAVVRGNKGPLLE